MVDLVICLTAQDVSGISGVIRNLVSGGQGKLQSISDGPPEWGSCLLFTAVLSTWYRTWPQEGLCKCDCYYYCQQAISK